MIRNKINLPGGLRQHRGQPFCNRVQGTQFDVRNEGGGTELVIYDEIGYWGVTAADVKRALRGAGDVNVKINSPGGDAFDGIAIYNELVQHPGSVSVEVLGYAASAASIIAMAGDEIKLAGNAFLMIHNAWTVAIGDRNQFSHLAELLGGIDGSLADTYAARTGTPRDEIVEMMNAETWLTAEIASDLGFADEIGELKEPSAKFDLGAFAKAPEQIQVDFDDTGSTATKRDCERALMQDAKLSRTRARAILREGYQPDDVTQDADPDGIAAALGRLQQSLS